jgi:predicted amidophosphoribosyltransferase
MTDALAPMPAPGRCVWCGAPATFPSHYCRACIARLATEDRREAHEERAAIDEYRSAREKGEL